MPDSPQDAPHQGVLTPHKYMKPEIGQKSIFRFRGQKAGFFRCLSGNFLQKAEATFHSQKPGFSGFMK